MEQKNHAKAPNIPKHSRNMVDDFCFWKRNDDTLFFIRVHLLLYAFRLASDIFPAPDPCVGRFFGIGGNNPSAVHHHRAGDTPLRQQQLRSSFTQSLFYRRLRGGHKFKHTQLHLSAGTRNIIGHNRE